MDTQKLIECARLLNSSFPDDGQTVWVLWPGFEAARFVVRDGELIYEPQRER